jgi:hypothetical protein
MKSAAEATAEASVVKKATAFMHRLPVGAYEKMRQSD